MSIHAAIPPELQKKLKSQQRWSAVSSAIIAILFVTLIGLVLALCLLPSLDNFTPEIVTYQASAEQDDKIRKPQFNRMVQRKPNSPSSSMARVIAASTVSEMVMPVPTDVVEVPMDFGSGEDMGDGWGDGDGWGGAAGGEPTFFGQKLTGQRILYIIDYSQSMKGERQKLMRSELAKSVTGIPHDKKFQMIFFAGPVWVAGSDVSVKGKKSAVVKFGNATYHWVSQGKAHQWKPGGDQQVPQWLSASDEQVNASVKVVKKSKLVWGTNWENPLEMAFTMDPQPEVIIFMTDGVAKGDPLAIADFYAKRAKRKNITINTIALMEPKAAAAMEKLAKGTGGSFALINEKGEKVKR